MPWKDEGPFRIRGHRLSTAHEPDEGIGAHLFQIWLALEVLMIGFFAIKWLPQRPKEASFILMILIAAVVAGCFRVFYFKL